MRRKIMAYGLIAFLAILFSGIASFSFAEEQKDNDPHATGLKEPTKIEREWMQKHWYKVKEVKPNKLGLERINKEREKKGLQKLDEKIIALPADEIISAIEEDFPYASETLPAEELLEALPLYVDNSQLPSFPPIRSQGSLGSCASFSTVYYQLTHMVGLQRGWNNKNDDNTTKFSPKWTYNFVNGGRDAGSTLSSVYGVLESHGAATWAEFPYDSNYREWSLNPVVWQNAITFRTNPVQYVSGSSTDTGLQQIKQLLNNGYALIYATYVNSWQYTAIKNDPSTTVDDPFVGKQICYWVNGALGGHGMTIVGYNDNIWADINSNGIVDAGEKGALRIANSWGTYWNDGGFTWLAYDALKSASAVSGAPSSGRQRAFFYDEVYAVTVRPFYTPRMLAQFTVNHLKREQLSMTLGVSDTTQASPAAIWYSVINSSSGAYAFDGTTVACDGTFVFDFSDILPTVSSTKRYYLGMRDLYAGDPATLKNFKIIDVANGGIETNSTTVPQTIDAGLAYAYVDYAFNSGNYAPIARISATPLSGPVPLDVAFDGTGSSDPDGTIVTYQWNFGDGASGLGATITHRYNSAGNFIATLTVIDNLGGSSSGSVSIAVNPDPNIIVAPTNLTATVASKTVTLRWTDNSYNEEGFYIERGVKVGKTTTYTRVATVGANITTHIATVGKGSYIFRVQAFNLTTGKVSGYSNSVSVRIR